MQRCHRLPQAVVPLFPVSSVTGKGLAALHAFLNRLQGASSPVPGLAQQRVAPGMQHQQVGKLRHLRLTTGFTSLCWPVDPPSYATELAQQQGAQVGELKKACVTGTETAALCIFYQHAAGHQ